MESRSERAAVERTWSKLTNKVDIALGRGESVIVAGDLNRPVQAPKPSFGTKLLLDWVDKGTMVLLNNKDTPTRLDPVTGKGSTLDLGLVSASLANRLFGGHGQAMVSIFAKKAER